MWRTDKSNTQVRVMPPVQLIYCDTASLVQKRSKVSFMNLFVFPEGNPGFDSRNSISGFLYPNEMTQTERQTDNFHSSSFSSEK